MKKWILITAAVMFAAGLVLGGAYAAVAQGNTPPSPLGGFGGMVRGWMHSQTYTGTVPFGRGPMLGQGGQGGPLYGTMMLPGGVHEQVWTAVAQELGLTYDQLQAKLKTKTLEQLAQEKNVTLDKLQQVYKTAHKAALDQLVQEGKLTREQADQMIQRMDAAGYPMLNGAGRGTCPCCGDDDDTPGQQGLGGPRGQSRGGRGRMMPGLPGLPGRSG
jgi:hypothetical protein